MELTVCILECGIRAIKLTGRLDSDSAATVEAHLLLQAASTKACVIIDLSQLDFIGSIGLRMLLKCAKAQQMFGGKLVLCSAGSFVREVLSVAGIPNAIPLYQTIEEACALGFPGLLPATPDLSLLESSHLGLQPTSGAKSAEAKDQPRARLS